MQGDLYIKGIRTGSENLSHAERFDDEPYRWRA